MSTLFKDKVILITGGNAGIGRATALAFAEEGANVVIAARREKESMDVIAAIKAKGAQAIYVHTDVSKVADLHNMVKQTLATFGRLDFAFNNAGVLDVPSALSEKTEAAYHQVMDINVKGVLFSMQAEIPAMLKTGGGVIINNASIAGLIGFANVPIYIASKHAVLGLTKSVALEVARQHIRVNAVSPAAIETDMFRQFAKEEDEVTHMREMHPVGRVGKPEEIASAVLWLCSPGAAFVTGQSITIDGGFTAQ